MQSGDPLTVRVVSKDGTERYEVKPTETLLDLKKKIQHKTLLPVASLTLSSDRPGKDVLANNSSTFSSLGIRHGQMIFLSYTAERPFTEPKKLGNIKKQWDLKSLNEHMDKQGLIFKAQETTHCTGVSLDFASCDKFQQYPRQFGFLRRREGHLYGKYQDDGGVVVEYIYEPPQEHTSAEGLVQLIPDQQEEQLVETIAKKLGVEKVGWIFTVPPVKEAGNAGKGAATAAAEARERSIMSSFEIMRAAELQIEASATYGDMARAFVTIKVSSDAEGQVQFEAFQVTDQMLKLVQSGLVYPPRDPRLVVIKAEVAMARQGAGRKDSRELDPDVLIKPVAVTNHTGPLACKFEIENRPEQPQNMAALKRYMLQFKGKPFLVALTDFHFIRYLGKEHLSPETDIPALCEAVVRGDADALEGFKLLIDSIAGVV